HVVACEPDHDRAEDETVVARAFERETDAAVETRSDVAGALDVALDAADAGDAVVVAGSLHAVAEARARWARPKVPKRVDSLAEAEATLEDADVGGPGVWRMRGKAVHRVVRTRVQPRQAQYLKEELLSLGGECAISALNDQDRENLDVVLLGTLAQFRRLVEKLDGQPYGLAPLADELRATLSVQTERVPDSVPEAARPGADVVPVDEEIERVVPVIEALAETEAMVSIDTRKAPVARAAIEAGADLLNDVSGLEDPEMRLVAADHDVPVVVMHSIETPVDPDSDVHYDDVVADVIDYLTERVLLAEKAGLDRSQILVDPGLGFGKSPRESFELLGRLGELRALGCPVLVGHSHKSMLELAGGKAGDALPETVAATAIAADRGADIIRVHDAAENVNAVRVAMAAADPDAVDPE
ncbi:dihydropteroate synthase, partial [Halobacteriales archaeon QH_8_68_33]